MAKAEDTNGRPNAKKATPIRVQLTVQVEDQAVTAKLIFENVSKKDAFVDKRMGGLRGPKLVVPVFTIQSDGQPIKYKGHLAKFAAPGPSDYVRLKPGEHAEANIRLDEVYRFLPGPHRYTATYAAAHGNPTKKTELNELTSNEESFELDLK